LQKSHQLPPIGPRKPPEITRANAFRV